MDSRLTSGQGHLYSTLACQTSWLFDQLPRTAPRAVALAKQALVRIRQACSIACLNLLPLILMKTLILNVIKILIIKLLNKINF